MEEHTYENLISRIETFDKNKHIITVSKLLNNEFLITMPVHRKLEKKDTVIYIEHKICAIISKIYNKLSVTKSLLVIDRNDYYIDDNQYQELLSKYFNDNEKNTNDNKHIKDNDSEINTMLTNIDDDIDDLDEHFNKFRNSIKRNDHEFVFMPPEYFIKNKIDRYNIIDLFTDKIKKVNINI